jgi:hypothetical protein
LFYEKGNIAELEHRRSVANAVITFNAKKRFLDRSPGQRKHFHDLCSR